jgi:transcriptional regulator with PAS, ATPase and Fis domain
MQKVYKAIGRVSATDATVLIRGESGTGKELAARAIFQHSLRANSPFLVINCVAIPDTLLESELFGYEKGAFTGATHRRVGKIEQASGGTVFLDEIGDMPLNLQAKMLRLLQEKSVERLGGRETIPVDVRIIAATNRDLETLITQGQFREDLYYRLKVITIWLPPLGERREDIALLCEHFLVRFAKEPGHRLPRYGQRCHGGAANSVPGPAMCANWPTPCKRH